MNDFDKKVWFYFLKHNSYVFVTIKRWKTKVENKTKLKIKCLSSDKSRDYDLAEFKRLCADEEITCTRLVLEKARQNMITERMNKMLNECIRNVRLHVGRPKVFKVDALNTITYLTNRRPSTPLGFKIPKDVWSNKEAKFSYLWTFVRGLCYC